MPPPPTGVNSLNRQEGKKLPRARKYVDSQEVLLGSDKDVVAYGRLLA